MPIARIALVVVCSLTLLSCGDDSGSGAGGARTCDAPAAPAATQSGDEMLDEINERGKPTVELPDEPATTLESTDLIEGTGAEAVPTSEVLVHYVGCGQASGQQFDASWDRGEPSPFPLSSVIEGWSEGMVGMKEGGRRQLVIPGDLAYGSMPPTPDIEPDETLVFVIDLIEVR